MAADAAFRYMEECIRVARVAADTQKDKIELAAARLARAVAEKKNIFAFGASHAGLITQELFYRTGGLAVINPIRAPGMNLDMTPITSTSKLERLPGYGRLILSGEKVGAGDVLILHSVSGRNAVAVEMAEAAHELGCDTIVLTNMTTSQAVTSRVPGGKKLYEVGDIVIDNCGSLGDASIQLEGIPEKCGPTSTVVGAMLLNAVTVRATEMIAAAGIEPPVFISANIDGGDEHNARILAEYKDNIFYM